MFYFRRFVSISRTVPRLFLSSYFILKHFEVPPKALCFNTNINSSNSLSEYRTFSTFLRNLPINRELNNNRNHTASYSQVQENTWLSDKDSTNKSHKESLNSLKVNNKHISKEYNNNNNNLKEHNPNYKDKMSNHYDLIVLGGGPGGMTAAKEAAKFGKKIILFDYVKPTKRGTSWGFGGTCVNVGCIPKKLMHYASLLKSSAYDRFSYGLSKSLDSDEVNWPKLIQTVQNYVKMLNFSYRSSLHVSGVEYVNSYATLRKNKTVEYELKGETKYVTGDKVIISLGERPYVPEDVEGAREFAITSDDLFSLKEAPGKTLVVGGSYVALECAGFLTGLGFDVTISVRSILLRGFDQQCANKVQELMEAYGLKFLIKNLPKKIERDNNRLKVTFNDNTTDYFDTVLYAAGRVPLDDVKHYQELGLEFDRNFNLVTNNEETSLKDVYAVGDILSNKPKLAPVAIKASELLIQRLYNNSTKQMNYENVPSCVYTPFEYSCCGLSEEDAIEKYGKDDVEVYLKEYSNLEISPVHRVNKKTNDEFDYPVTCLTKVVCRKDGTIVGLHFVGPNAGEIMQGFASLLLFNAKKSDLDELVAIHPTDAESFVYLTVTKSSNESWVYSQGCAGGKCG